MFSHHKAAYTSKVINGEFEKPKKGDLLRVRELHLNGDVLEDLPVQVNDGFNSYEVASREINYVHQGGQLWPCPKYKLRAPMFHNGESKPVPLRAVRGISVFYIFGRWWRRVLPPLDLNFADVVPGNEGDLYTTYYSILKLLSTQRKNDGYDLSLLGLPNETIRADRPLTDVLDMKFTPVGFDVRCSCGTSHGSIDHHKGHFVSLGPPTHLFPQEPLYGAAVPVDTLKNALSSDSLYLYFIHHLIITACQVSATLKNWVGAASLGDMKDEILAPILLNASVEDKKPSPPDFSPFLGAKPEFSLFNIGSPWDQLNGVNGEATNSDDVRSPVGGIHYHYPYPPLTCLLSKEFITKFWVVADELLNLGHPQIPVNPFPNTDAAFRVHWGTPGWGCMQCFFSLEGRVVVMWEDLQKRRIGFQFDVSGYSMLTDQGVFFMKVARYIIAHLEQECLELGGKVGKSAPLTPNSLFWDGEREAHLTGTLYTMYPSKHEGCSSCYPLFGTFGPEDIQISPGPPLCEDGV